MKRSVDILFSNIELEKCFDAYKRLKDVPILMCEWCDPRVFYSHLSKVSQCFPEEIKFITSFYMAYGIRVFRNVSDDQLKGVTDLMVSVLLRYSISVGHPQTTGDVSMETVIGNFPFFVAHYLRVGHGCVVGNLNGLPRCLAFPGGIAMVPAERSWQTLSIIWKVWRSSVNLLRGYAHESTEYLTIKYRDGFTESRREVFMAELDVDRPSVKTVISAIEKRLRKCQDENCLVMSEIFQNVFGVYWEEVMAFYEMHSDMYIHLGTKINLLKKV